MLVALAAPAALLTGTAEAQSEPHEYRSEVIAFTPAIGNLAAFFVAEDHLSTQTLNTTERQRGVGASYELGEHLTAQIDFRYINGSNAYLEHRWMPSVTARWTLPAAFELAALTRPELRDIRVRGVGPTWSVRAEEKVTLSRALRVARLPVVPFASLQPSYDTRVHLVNRWEERAGVRLPYRGVTTQLYGEWWQDSRSSTRRYGAFGVELRLRT